MNRLSYLFRNVQCPVIGMVHVGALPGTPLYRNNFEAIVERAVAELKLYKGSGIVRNLIILQIISIFVLFFVI